MNLFCQLFFHCINLIIFINLIDQVYLSYGKAQNKQIILIINNNN